jgi:Ca2+-binding EF-hand superfamily protein
MGTLVRVSLVLGMATIVVWLSADSASAQPPRFGFGGDPRQMQEQMFRRMDRNGNGVIDGEELEQLNNGFFREVAAGRDPSRPMDMNEFSELSQQAMERFRAGGGGPGLGGFRMEIRGPDGGGSGDNSANRDGSPRPDERRDGDRRDGDSRDERRGDSRRSDRDDSSRSNSDSRSSSRKSDKPAGFSFGSVTLKLPDQYRSKDKDGDGQIGLYEWPRSDFATFRKLDRDGDGFLTAAELIKSSGGSVPNFGIPSNVTIASTDPAAATTALSVADTGRSVGSGTSAFPGPPSRIAGPSTPGGASSASTDGTDELTRRAGFTFDNLDRDRNGVISAEEWARSRSMRPQFERANAGLVPPISREQFVPAFVKVNPSFSR